MIQTQQVGSDSEEDDGAIAFATIFVSAQGIPPVSKEEISKIREKAGSQCDGDVEGAAVTIMDIQEKLESRRSSTHTEGCLSERHSWWCWMIKMT